MKKIIVCILLCVSVLSSVVLSGCSGDTDGAETALKFYFSALKGFNVNAMEENVKGEYAGDIGFAVEELSEDFRQSDNYKKHIEDMMRALSSTFVFTINSSEAIDDSRVDFNVTMKCSDVNEEDLGEYMQEKVDKYIIKHPEVYDMDSYEYEETMIGVQADAYEVFLEKQPRTTKDFTVAVVNVDGKWMITTKDNTEFFAFLQEIYESDDNVERPEESETEEAEVAEETEE